MSELAQRAGLPIATVKYYLRERLLAAGEPTAATQAQYSEAHLARLRLIRALLGPGGLSIATAREVLRAIDDPATSVHQALGAAHGALPGTPVDTPADLTRAWSCVQRWGWQVNPDSPALAMLAVAIDALAAAGFEPSDALLDRYAAAADQLGRQDVAEVPTQSLLDAVRFVVVNTVLLEPVLLALRRLAQENSSQRRFPDTRLAGRGGRR